MLKLKNIRKVYHSGEDVVALNNVSIEFGKTGFVSILGPSGCGKTTLLNTIGGLDVYDSGDLIIKGKSTKSFKSSKWDAYRNSCVGFVFQNYNLITHQTVLKNVEVALTLSGVSKAERKKRAKKALADVGLESHMNKKPTQLSGGQMQRVAIARALVNNPEIILADEPTGALDTNTSVKIMEILKEISKEKLVIMVTHNPDLANKYSSRIIKMLDGGVESDTQLEEDGGSSERFAKFKKVSMSIFSAIGLSFGNLMTKKWRTALTSFAGSIGIIGVAIILAISNGSKILVNQITEKYVGEYPIVIGSFDVDGFAAENKMPEYPDDSKITVLDYDKPADGKVGNGITQEYLNYIEKMKQDLKDNIAGVQYITDMHINVLAKNGSKVTPVGMTSSFNELPNDPEVFKKQYEFVGEGSRMPVNKNEVVLIINKKNTMSAYLLERMGINKDEVQKAEDLIGKTWFKVIENDFYYIKQGNNFGVIGASEAGKLYDDKTKGVELKIVGVVRPSRESGAVSAGSNGIGYTEKLEEYIRSNSMNSQIVKYQKASDFDVIKNTKFKNQFEKEDALRLIGGCEIPSKILIKVTNLDSSKKVQEYLNKYNEGKPVDEKVKFKDSAEGMKRQLTSMVDVVSVVLGMFASVSLIVSSIMIAILTYVSVLERTKEIGVLRAIGARKKDVSRLFNAENIIIGFISGTFGVIATYLLSNLINQFAASTVNQLIEGGSLAVLNPVHAICLVALSMLITLIAGFIPSKLAARKNPVEALRTE